MPEVPRLVAEGARLLEDILINLLIDKYLASIVRHLIFRVGARSYHGSAAAAEFSAGAV